MVVAGDLGTGPADDAGAAALPHLLVGDEAQSPGLDGRRGNFQRQRQPAQRLGQSARPGGIVRLVLAAGFGGLQQESFGVARAQHIQVQPFDVARELRQPAGHQHMAATAQPPEQCVRGCQRRSVIDVVQDQQPAGIGVEPSQHCLEPCFFLGQRRGRQAERNSQRGDSRLQLVRRLGGEKKQRGIVVAIVPSVFHGGAGLAHTAHAMHRLAGDGGGASLVQAAVQAIKKRATAFEEASERWIRQNNGFRRQFLRPVLLQDEMAQVMDIAEIVPVQTLLINNIPDQRLLKLGPIGWRCSFVGGRPGIGGDVDRKPPLVVAGEEELPLSIGRLADSRWQHGGKRCGGGGWRHGAAALANDAHHGGAVPDIVVQLAQSRVGIRLLPEVALNAEQQVARPQACRQGIAGRTELAGHCREKDAEVRRHTAPVPDRLRHDPDLERRSRQRRIRYYARSGTDPLERPPTIDLCPRPAEKPRHV